MQRVTTLLLIVAICSIASLASPHGLGALDIHEAARSEDHVLSGPAALRKAYLKYGAIPPPALAARAGTGSVKATPTENDGSYIIPAAIGQTSPTTSITMNLDTGSDTFSVYAPKLSTTKSGLQSQATAAVNIGGIVVSRQVVTTNSDSFGNSNLVGMLPTSGTFYSNAVKAGTIAPYLGADLKKGAAGKYTLGYIDTAAYKGSITYATVDASQPYWRVAGNGYAVGTGAFVSLKLSAIVDTGTSLLLLPQSLVTAYYDKVASAKYDSTQGGYTFPCTASLPSLTLGIGTYKAVVPGTYMNFAPIDSKTCFGGLQSDSDIGVSIFGLVFIKSQYVVFKGPDSAGLSVGFAQKA